MNQLNQSQLDRVEAAWDANCVMRAHDIESGLDRTYHQTIVPYVLGFLRTYGQGGAPVLDIGCGCGYLTEQLSRTNAAVGLDLSQASITYAASRYPGIPFVKGDIGMIEFGQTFPLAIATLVVNYLHDFPLFLRRVSALLASGGRLLIVAPHPCFWPFKGEPLPDFQYARERAYTLPFHINGNDQYPASVSFVHRSLGRYLQDILESPLTLEALEELYEPDHGGQTKALPHLLGLVLKK